MAPQETHHPVLHLDALSRPLLDGYGLTPARVTLLRKGDNMVFRVDGPADRRFALSLHTAARHPAAALALELDWLDRLSGAAHLPVPQPVRHLGGPLDGRFRVAPAVHPADVAGGRTAA